MARRAPALRSRSVLRVRPAERERAGRVPARALASDRRTRVVRVIVAGGAPVRIYQRTAVLLTVGALLGGLLPAGAAVAASPPAKPTASGVVFFAADGMRPDLMEKYAAQGVMPTYAKLMATGVKGANGMVQAFPPNTGVGWYTLATGAYPGETRLDQQHLLPDRRERLQQPHRRLLGRRAPGRHDRRGRRAGRQEGRLGRVGRRLANDDRPAGPGRRLPQLLLEPRPLDELGRPRPAGRRHRVRRPVPARRPGRRGRLDERPGQLQPGASRGRSTSGRTRAARRAVPVIANDQYDFYVYDSTERREGQLRPRR